MQGPQLLKSQTLVIVVLHSCSGRGSAVAEGATPSFTIKRVAALKLLNVKIERESHSNNNYCEGYRTIKQKTRLLYRGRRSSPALPIVQVKLNEDDDVLYHCTCRGISRHDFSLMV